MSTQKYASGRRASQVQRDLAKEILKRFKQTSDLNSLLEALEYFSQTGDFSPFGESDRQLQKRAKFLRLCMQVKQLRGKEKADFIGKVAIDEGMSEESVKRMLSGKTQINSGLTGVDRLFDYLEKQLKFNPIKRK